MSGFFDNVGVEKVVNKSVYDQLYEDIADQLNMGYGIILPVLTRNDKGEREFNWNNISATNNIPECTHLLLEITYDHKTRLDKACHKIDELEDKIKELEIRLSKYEAQRDI